MQPSTLTIVGYLILLAYLVMGIFTWLDITGKSERMALLSRKPSNMVDAWFGLLLSIIFWPLVLSY